MTVFLLLLTGVCSVGLGWLLGWFLRSEPKRSTVAEVPPVRNARDEVIDFAFEEIDRDELGALFLVEVPPAPVSEAPIDMQKQEEVPSHPCDFLYAGAPAPFKESECSGTCGSPSQRGRVCFWASQSAANCPHFRPRLRTSRVRLNKLSS